MLTCYVRATGELFASHDPWLIDRGARQLRFCTRTEGDGLDPKTLPGCP